MFVTVYAKINLFLCVGGRRSDGYHEIDTIYQTVRLADNLEFKRVRHLVAPELALSPESTFQAPLDDTNLIIKAIKLLEPFADKESKHVRVRLTKHIPVGAGLGGGSADAAATLVAMDQLCSLRLERATLTALAAKLGADVPVFIQGGTARGSGKGEILTTLTNRLMFYTIIVFPGFSINTARAYQLLSSARHRRYAPPDSGDMLVDAIESGDFGAFCSLMWNDFHEIMAQQYPELSRLEADLLDAGCSTAQLSGSGSALYGIVKQREHAEEIKALLEKKYPYIYVAEPTAQGIELKE